MSLFKQSRRKFGVACDGHMAMNMCVYGGGSGILDY